eukprot:19068-Heterococcus_DN1.PRE.3
MCIDYSGSQHYLELYPRSIRGKVADKQLLTACLRLGGPCFSIHASTLHSIYSRSELHGAVKHPEQWHCCIQSVTMQECCCSASTELAVLMHATVSNDLATVCSV